MPINTNELTDIPHWVYLLFSTAITALIKISINCFFERKARLICYYDHIGSHTIKTIRPAIHLNTHVLAIENQGSSSATGIKINHYKIPPSLSFPDIDVRPSMDYELGNLPDGTKELRIPKLVKGERVTVSYIYFDPLVFNNINSSVKFDDGYAEVIKVMPTHMVIPPKIKGI